MGTFIDLLWGIAFSIIGALVGIFLLINMAKVLPKIFDKLTPNIDEGKEIIRGNVAVAEYFSRIVSASIIGISIIIAASIVAGIIAALHY